MQTIVIGKGRYTVHENRKDVMSKLLSYTGAPRKPRLKPVQRRFPPAGAHMAVNDYVELYYAMNALGSTRHFAPLSTNINIPQGEDTMETLA